MRRAGARFIPLWVGRLEMAATIAPSGIKVRFGQTARFQHNAAPAFRSLRV